MKGLSDMVRKMIMLVAIVIVVAIILMALFGDLPALFGNMFSILH